MLANLARTKIGSALKATAQDEFSNWSNSSNSKPNSKIFQSINRDPKRGLLMRKTRERKSPATVPLTLIPVFKKTFTHFAFFGVTFFYFHFKNLFIFHLFLLFMSFYFLRGSVSDFVDKYCLQPSRYQPIMTPLLPSPQPAGQFSYKF